jgi:agmatine deiminase
MKKRYISIELVVTLLLLGSFFVNAQQVNTAQIDNLLDKDKEWFGKNPDSLPIWLTQEELERLDEIGKGFKSTSAPPAPVRMPAEFEPMQGVLIRYNFGISYQIIKEMSEDVEVVTIVASQSEQNYVYSQYQSYGVNLENCDFLIAPTNSYWTRDYGPWFMFNGNNEQGIVDFIYNRPRPYDNQIPVHFGNKYAIPVYAMGLTHTGGNFMTDGQGIAVSTNIVYSENFGLTHEQINQIMFDYCGIDTYHVVVDPNNDYIKHVDCWGKYLSPDTILIREVPTSHPRYSAIEATVNYFASQNSCYSTPYNIVRVYTPNNEPYTNSLILNNKVLVPMYGTQWDDDAIASYENAMPGYEVLGFTGSWEPTDALHCRVMGITDRYMLYIKHTPLSGIQSNPNGYEIQAMIYPYSGQSVNTAQVFYRVDNGGWQYTDMNYLGDNYYHAIIPQQPTGTIVDYYINAKDDSGRSENHPYIGEPMAYSFTCELINSPPETPEISGPTKGKPGVEYEYVFVSNDAEQDNVSYFIFWGDGTSTGWLGPYASGEEATASHVWDKKDIYTIKIKARDIYGEESNWGQLDISIPHSRLILSNYLSFLSNLLKNIKFLLK